MSNRFAIITPCHNESAFIAGTISAMAAQSMRPTKWIIVNDSSDDETERIIEAERVHHPFIELLNIKREQGRSFGFKALAFNEAVRTIDLGSVDYIGNLDADIWIEPDYFRHILARFEENPLLGICGGTVYTKIGGAYITADGNPNSVAGAVQLFRIRCFNDIGRAYMPLPFGGIDAAAEAMARWKGWLVAKSLNDKVLEQRRTGSGEAKPIRASFRLGQRFHSLGYGWIFYTFRCAYRLKDRPMFLSSIVSLFGYVLSALRGNRVVLAREVVADMRSRHWHQLLRPFRRGTEKDLPANHHAES